VRRRQGEGWGGGGEGEGEEEEEVHSILVTDETTGSQMDLEEKSQDVSFNIRDV